MPATRLGYSFEGWYTHKTEGTKITSESIITKETDHTLYARWKANVPKTLTNKLVAGGSHNLVVDERGNLWAWGNNNCGQLGDGTTDNSMVPIQIKQGTKFLLLVRLLVLLLL